MKTVPFEEVRPVFSPLWHDSAEPLLHEILWDCLTEKGLTVYFDEKSHALIHVYAYILQMLCEEFAYMAYDDPCPYEFDFCDEEPLTGAALGYLYGEKFGRSSKNFTTDPNMMLNSLVEKLRHPVADVIFDRFGDFETGQLFFFAMNGEPLWENENTPSQPFRTKEELLSYCENLEECYLDHLKYDNESKVEHWTFSHSCAIDD